MPIGGKNQKATVITEVHGGSPYGAGVISGPDGSRQASPLELEIANWQGAEFGKLIARVKPDAGKKAAEPVRKEEPIKAQAPPAKTISFTAVYVSACSTSITGHTGCIYKTQSKNLYSIISFH